MKMRVLKEKEERLMRSLVSLTQEQMQIALHEYLQKKYDKVIKTESYLYAIGEIPIALVAHMDTVFSPPPSNVYYDRDHGVMWSPEGLGADDRAGIFIILSILTNTKLRPSIIFTCDEEMGAVGASQLVKDFLSPLSPLNYIIQLDRRGTNDCVFYSCDNQDFIKYVEGFGFSENFGSFSDISEICPIWGVAGTNLSVGYESEHSFIETLHIVPMFATYEKVIQMLKEENIPFFKYIKASRYFNNFGKKYQALGINFYPCSKCGQNFEETDLIPVIGKNGGITHLCFNCCSSGVEWCQKCGNAFELDGEDEVICYNCREEPSTANV